jgi:hypothetical protein
MTTSAVQAPSVKSAATAATMIHTRVEAADVEVEALESVSAPSPCGESRGVRVTRTEGIVALVALCKICVCMRLYVCSSICAPNVTRSGTCEMGWWSDEMQPATCSPSKQAFEVAPHAREEEGLGDGGEGGGSSTWLVMYNVLCLPVFGSALCHHEGAGAGAGAALQVHKAVLV